jgi:transposase
MTSGRGGNLWPVPHAIVGGLESRATGPRATATTTAYGGAEVGDFARFQRPAQLMSYLGLVPSERSTGEARRQGAITKSGSSLARWLLIETAWHYRHTPRVGTKLARRQQGQEPAVIALS